MESEGSCLVCLMHHDNANVTKFVYQHYLIQFECSFKNYVIPILHKVLINNKGKGNLLYCPGVARRVGRFIVLLFHDCDTGRGEWSAAPPGCNLPLGKTRYSFNRRLGVPQDPSARAENFVPTVIRSRTIHPVSQSLYRLSYIGQSLIIITHEH